MEEPGTTFATIPPSMPAERSSTLESSGTGYSPWISSRIVTPFWSMVKPITRPMFTPRICTGSPRRIPPASGTFVVTM